MKKEKSLKICPKCGSVNISFDTFSEAGPVFDVCKDCGYGGKTSQKFVAIPEIKEFEIEKFRKNLHRNNIDYKELTKEVTKFKKKSKKDKYRGFR